ncbi:Hypothetical_protein [Hexamita inflata]|uniref:Hypothetical_protein n=1 Tax=Hexamita inflata TaxID=28002 RepID=A0AA86TMS1_9EUKA|nr:Hypothetical protein HINF_LOCUS9675 [Hexamita inflata]CAI9922034.1 Hypothetical protein HINF_LOCUS9679 [Hexamita inflata]
MSKAFVDKELGCQSQVHEVTILHLRRPLFYDCSTRIYGSYNLLEYVENSHLLRAVRSCLLISNLLINKKELIQLLKVPQSSQMRPRSSYYSKFSHDDKDYYCKKFILRLLKKLSIQELNTKQMFVAKIFEFQESLVHDDINYLHLLQCVTSSKND